MSTFPDNLTQFLNHSEPQSDVQSDPSGYEQQVQAQVDQLGPEPSLAQAVSAILTQSVKAELEAKKARQILDNTLRQTVQVVKTQHDDIEAIKNNSAATNEKQMN